MQTSRNLSVLFVNDPRVLLELLQHWTPAMSLDQEMVSKPTAAALAQQFRSALGAERWQITCAGNASQGLELMSHARFDMVVAGLKLPGRTGVELLRKVRELNPSCVRVIHSNCSDDKLMLECAGLIHEFLPKQCSVESFRATLQRAALNRSLLPNPRAREEVSRMERLPSLPALYFQLAQQVQSLEISVETIAATVSQDLAMTTKILRIVNSGFFGLPRTVSDVSEAIAYLGLEMMKHLVLAAGIFEQFHSQKLGGISLDALWHHSSQAATVARFIARSEAAGRRIIDDSFTAGLLHDVGKLVLACNYPDKYQAVAQAARAKDVEWLVEERAVFGFDHGDVGAYLLGLWNFPAAVVEAVAFHHSPSRTGRTEFSALTAVHVADVLCQTKRISYGGVRLPQVDRRHLEDVGKLAALDQWREDILEPMAA